MFSKSKSQSPQSAATQPAQPAAAAASARQAKTGGGVPSIISPDLTITGDLHSSGDIQVDGVRGSLTVDHSGSGDVGHRNVGGTVTLPRNK